MSNEWFERGELPPVGFTQSDCQTVNQFYEDFSEFKIIEHYKDCAVVMVTEFKNGNKGCWAHVINRNHFRPIRTEREKSIEAAALVIELNHGSSGSLLYKKYCESLYDAGLLRLPEDKK